MHVKLIAAALAVAATPVPALAAVPQAPSSASSGTVTAHGGAARIEACIAATNTLIENLEKGDTSAATADFDSTMKANLDAGKLGQVWQQVGSQAGKLEKRGTPQNMMYKGLVVVLLPLQFQKADINAQVACDASGKIAGFFLRPAPAGSVRAG